MQVSSLESWQLIMEYSIISKLPVLRFCCVMLFPFLNESISISLFLTHVYKVFFGTQYFAATTSSLIRFSKSLRALHFSGNVL